MSEQSTMEKRQHLRLPRPYRVEARELVFPIARDPIFSTECCDISKGGLCVESPKMLPVGTRLQVSVHIPLLNKFSPSFYKVYENDAEQYFNAIADVAWAKPSGGVYLLGLAFINTDPDMCKALGSLVDKAFAELKR